MKTTTKEILKEFDLTENETQIYLTLLKHSNSTAGQITKETGIHRRNVYDSIARLIEKGLVGYIKENNIKVYEASNPEKFNEILKRKQENLNSILPELQQIFNLKQKEKKQTLFYKGKEGIKHIFEDQIKEGKTIHIMGASTEAFEVLKYYLPHYERERKKKNISSKILFSEDLKKEKPKIPLSKIKYLPEELTGPAATNIYGDNVAIIIWSENPYAILIKDKAVAQSYLKYFEVMWNIGK